MARGDGLVPSDIFEIHVPIVLGVTGHRDIRPEDRPRLLEAVQAIFQDFRIRYPTTPLRLLSSLARGADELAAEAAEKFGEKNVAHVPVDRVQPDKKEPVEKSRVEVVAPLPFPVAVYAGSSTFAGHDEEKNTFLKRINKLKGRWFIVPFDEKCSDASNMDYWWRLANETSSRHACYANAGGYIIRHCNALIALWDGKPGKESGTEEMVRCKQQGKMPEYYPGQKPLIGSEPGPVFVIHTPRAGDDTRQNNEPMDGGSDVLVPHFDEPLTKRERAFRPTRWQSFWRRLWEATGISHSKSSRLGEWRQFHETCQMIEEFNRDIKQWSSSDREGFKKRVSHLNQSNFWQSAAKLHDNIPVLIALREATATLAGSLDHRFRRWQVALFASLFASVLCFHFRAELSEFSEMRLLQHAARQWLLPFFFAFLILAAVVVWRVWYRRLYERRLDYRAFSEALRVRLFWAVAGIGESVADSYLGQMRGEMSWARRALMALAPPPAEWSKQFGQLSEAEKIERLRDVTDLWVKGQTKFYSAASRKHRRRAFIFQLLGYLLGIGGGLSLAAMATYCLLRYANLPLTPYLLIGAAFLISLGGFLLLYCERASYKELAKQYERLLAIFEQGEMEIDPKLSDATQIEFIQETLTALGREAITENVQWLILRRERPLELLFH